MPKSLVVFLPWKQKNQEVRINEVYLFRGYILISVYTKTDYLVLSLEQLQRWVDQRGGLTHPF